MEQKNEYCILIEHEPYKLVEPEKTKETWIKVGRVKVLKGEPTLLLNEQHGGRIYIAEIKTKRHAVEIKKEVEFYIDMIVSKFDRIGNTRFMYWAVDGALSRFNKRGKRVIYNDFDDLFPESKIVKSA